MFKKRIDVTGQKFERLTAIRFIKETKLFLCKCDCGNEYQASSHELRSGRRKSCGCYRNEHLNNKIKHGKCNTAAYSSWAHLIQRCNNPKSKNYVDYGGRGIKVSEKWLTFEGFYEDMGDAPKNHSIERHNVNGNYCKENCIWLPKNKQAQNQRSNNKITFRGKTQNLSDWARELNMPRYVLSQRIVTMKWPIERALTEAYVKRV